MGCENGIASTSTLAIIGSVSTSVNMVTNMGIMARNVTGMVMVWAAL